MSLSLRISRLALGVIAGSIVMVPAQAAPTVNLEAGLSQFQLVQKINEEQAHGGRVLDVHQTTYDSGTALRLGAELVWRGDAQPALVAGARAIYGRNGEFDTDFTDLATGTSSTSRSQSLTDIALLGLHGGARWTRELTPRLQLQAELGGSFNSWRINYDFTGISASVTPSSITTFATTTRHFSDHDSFAALEGKLGLSYAWTEKLAAVLSLEGMRGVDYTCQQANLGFRYRLR